MMDIFLAQRKSLPFLGQQDAAHVGMARELDSEHVEHLALQPVRARVYIHCRRGLRTIRDHGLHPHALVAREAVENVDQLEAFGAIRIIHRRDVHQVIEIPLPA